MQADPVPPPWGRFLDDLDRLLNEQVELHCIGGFVVSLLYGLRRPTGDVDVISTLPGNAAPLLSRVAGRDSGLHRRHGVFLQIVTVATVAEKYTERLSEMFAGAFSHLRLLALDPYDLALSKIERNLDQDIEDVKYLARVVPFDLEELRRRYAQELRPYLARPQREDLTLQLWIDAISENRSKQP